MFSSLLSFINPYMTAIKIGLFAVYSAALIFGGYHYHSLQDEAALTAAAIKGAQEQKVTDDAATSAAVNDLKAQLQNQANSAATVEEIPVYVTKKAVSSCTIPIGPVWVWNQASSGVPDTNGPLKFVDTASGVGLDTATATIVKNYYKYHSVAKELVDLQALVVKYQKQLQAIQNGH